MGFDLYGINPQQNKPEPAILSKFKTDGFNDWDKMTKKDKEVYFQADNIHQEINPGVYFRNNVWWWRPLWTFVGAACEGILTERDIEAGSYNDGHRISKTKSKRIAARLRKLDKNGMLDKYEAELAPMIKKARKHNKMIELKVAVLQKRVIKETGIEDIVPMDYPEKFAKKYQNLRDKEDWSGNYPFIGDNVRDFTRFCEESGGFEIC